MAAMVVASVEGKPEQEKIESPNDIYFARLDKTIEETGGKGSMLVRGIERDDDEDEDEDEEDEEKDGSRTDCNLTSYYYQ